ncbi:hypothetical protein M1432_02295 [Patescibacteria group bacterium]|nr:hypothetical protein [Patescibacteria group bacterium]
MATTTLPLNVSEQGAIGLIITVITLFVVVCQLYLMRKQLHLMKRQDEIIARRADLTAQVEYTSSREFVFDVSNIGKRGVVNFDWHLWIPIAFGDDVFVSNPYPPQSASSGIMEINGQKYFEYAGNFRDFVYPTRRKIFARLQNRNVSGQLTFYYQIACEDGLFPEHLENNPLKITVQ